MKTQSPEQIPKRHCMVVHAYYPIGEARVEREAKALVDRGYDVDVFCLQMKGEPSEECIDGIQIYRLPVQRHRGQGVLVQLVEYLSFFWMVFFRLFNMQRKQGYDSVQVHNLPDFLVFAALAPRMSGAKIILDLHDLMPEFYASTFQTDMQSLPVRLLIWQENLSCRFANHVITVTELWRQTLIQRGQPPEKVSVVMNVADDRVFIKNGHSTPPCNGFHQRFHLIYHGTLTKRYGIDLLIQAVAQVRSQIPEIYLTIHGRGEYLEEITRLVHEHGLDDCVDISTRYVAINELPRLIQQADLGIVPYRRNIFTDGILPTKLMEYVALGVPVLAARTPIITQYFDDSMVQFFTAEDVNELSQNILLLYANPQKLGELVHNAERFNQTYSWKNVAGGYADLVDRLNGVHR